MRTAKPTPIGLAKSCFRPTIRFPPAVLRASRCKRFAAVEADPLYRYQPDHPLAIKDGKWKGYVAYPNIDLTTQMVDAMESTRAYEANVGVMEITKNLSRETLTILA